MYRPLRILLADDDPEGRAVAARNLQGENDRIDTAVPGQPVVALAAGMRYDVIVLAVKPPAFDSLNTAIAIRAAEQLRDEEPVPLVAFCQDPANDLCERCAGAGINEFIKVPADSLRLADAVRKWADTRPAVLLADDSPHVRQLVRQQLRGTCRVVTARNGREALDQFARQPIALVLLDMNMPVLDGFATAAAIRQRSDGQLVPIIALTASEDDEARTRAAAAGCTSHVVKPVTARVLHSIVASALHQADGSPAAVETVAPSAHSHADVRVEVEPFMADLIPEYVTEKRRQVRDLKRSMASRDLSHVRRVAHELKGTGAAYGIPEVTRLGGALESAEKNGDAAAAAALVDELDDLLARVQEKLGA